MKDMKVVRRTLITVALLAGGMSRAAPLARAQHVTPAMAATMGAQGPAVAGCEERARQATRTLDVLNSSLERARRTGDESEVRTAMDALLKGFADVKTRLAPCRESAAAQASPNAVTTQPAPPGGGTAGMDHSKMNMGGAQPPAASAKPAAVAMAGMDHSKMNMGGGQAPAGAAAAPTTVRQISGPAEAALQSFQDALQIGNREVALQWLAPEATITEAGVTDTSRDAYADEHMGVDMTFLKTAKVVLLDRQVHAGAESTHIVTTSRVTGRAGEIPVDVTVTEGASLKRTPEGWRIASIEWTVKPADIGGR